MPLVLFPHHYALTVEWGWEDQFPSCVLGKELRVVESDPKDAFFLSTVLGTGCIPEVPNYTGTPRKQPL